MSSLHRKLFFFFQNKRETAIVYLPRAFSLSFSLSFMLSSSLSPQLGSRGLTLRLRATCSLACWVWAGLEGGRLAMSGSGGGGDGGEGGAAGWPGHGQSSLFTAHCWDLPGERQAGWQAGRLRRLTPPLPPPPPPHQNITQPLL